MKERFAQVMITVTYPDRTEETAVTYLSAEEYHLVRAECGDDQTAADWVAGFVDINLETLAEAQ